MRPETPSCFLRHATFSPKLLHIAFRSAVMPLVLRSAAMAAQATCTCCSGGAHRASGPRATRSNVHAARLSHRSVQKAEARRLRQVACSAAADGEHAARWLGW
jgi:hypothetical protein